MTEPLDAIAAIAGDAWLVGGALRDRLLGRQTADYDVVVPAHRGDEVRRIARALGRATSAYSFPLSDEFSAWRVVFVRPVSGARSADSAAARCAAGRLATIA